MTVTGTINLSNGAPALSTAYLMITPHMDKAEVTGVVPVDLIFYVSTAAQAAGADRVYPKDTNGNKITNLTLQVHPTDVVKAGANCQMSDVFTYYEQLVATALSTAYGWTVTTT
jgi:hypothetical protein